MGRVSSPVLPDCAGFGPKRPTAPERHSAPVEPLEDSVQGTDANGSFTYASASASYGMLLAASGEAAAMVDLLASLLAPDPGARTMF